MPVSYLIGVLVRAPLIILSTALMGSISLVVAFWDSDGRQQLAVARVWARMLLLCAGARVKVVGLEKVDPHASYVVCPNHVSYFDTPVLLSYIPANFRFLAKQELFAIPFIGGHLRRAGNISVPLEDPRAALRVLSAAGKAMRERGLSMLVFPEGGRSESGELEEFKDGAAYLAIKGGVPILPVAIIGVRNVLPMHSHHVRPGRVTLRIGDPIPTVGLHSSNRAEVTRRIFDTISRLRLEGL
ncbi:MAG: 1-acyl-sn-glycerol-3-phosphate acyltransferase [Candidatus Solibacter usitatus]|nr:1-acyl-sn-glycerol-3-phosphate acyltransferase [Candidatus Solibacter usitatus]